MADVRRRTLLPEVLTLSNRRQSTTSASRSQSLLSCISTFRQMQIRQWARVDETMEKQHARVRQFLWHGSFTNDSEILQSMRSHRDVREERGVGLGQVLDPFVEVRTEQDQGHEQFPLHRDQETVNAFSSVTDDRSAADMEAIQVQPVDDVLSDNERLLWQL